jgi:prophage maintenance system killer protein
MNILTIEEILFIHYRVLVEFEPNSSDFLILNLERLERVLNQLQQHGRDTFSKAALIAKSLITESHFPEGNKLLGIIAGIVFMLNNGFNIRADNEDVYEAAIKIITGIWEEEDLEYWFKEHFSTDI